MLRKIIMLLAISHSCQIWADELPYKSDELIVRFATKGNGQQLSLSERNGILTEKNVGTIKHCYKLVPGLSVVKLSGNRTVPDALKSLENASGILYAEPNYKIVSLSTTPDDPNFDGQWALHNTGQESGTADADIDALQAWDISTGSSNIIVAVLDWGIDMNHPDLSDHIWVNSGEIPDNEIDDDNNTFVDDVYGWDFASDEDEQGDNDPTDESWHGTHCAGIVGAVGDNGEGVAGVCWSVTIMNVKISPGIIWDDESILEAFTSQAIKGIDYAVSMGADILSCSWAVFETESFSVPQALKDAIDYADNEGVIVVAGAGNNGHDIDIEGNEKYPASYDCNNIIAVMATDRDDDIGSGWLGGYSSNWGGTSVDLAAPGTDILSTTPTYQTYDMQNKGIDTDYDTASGTSMATPHVAGACALVWAVYPQLSHLQVKQAILDNVDVLEDLDGLCVTEGRLNVYKALASLNTTCVFSVEDSSSERVARLDAYGNLFLVGTLTEDGNPAATASDEFLVQDSSSTDVANINMSTGNMILDGSLHCEQTQQALSQGANKVFTVKNSSNVIVAYIDDSGNLYLAGTIFENSNP